MCIEEPTFNKKFLFYSFESDIDHCHSRRFIAQSVVAWLDRGGCERHERDRRRCHHKWGFSQRRPRLRDFVARGLQIHPAHPQLLINDAGGAFSFLTPPSSPFVPCLFDDRRPEHRAPNSEEVNRRFRADTSYVMFAV